MTRIEKNLRFFLGTTISNSTRLFWLNGIRKDEEGKYIQADSDVCIEGYQRSGNSFFFLLFRNKNKQVKIAHHTHGAAQVIKAVKLNIPTIVLIREPIDTLASLLAWDDNLSISVALKTWIAFYEKLLAYRSAVLVISFPEVTMNPVKVVEQLNHKYGTSFNLPIYKPAQLESIKSRVQARNQALSSPLPTEEKERAKNKYKEVIRAHQLYEKAQQLYLEFIAE